MSNTQKIQVKHVDISSLIPATYNPRKWDKDATAQLKRSLQTYGFVDPLIVNTAPGREGVVIGGHFRLHVAKELGYTEVPVVHVHIPDIEQEKELNLRLNRNVGEWDLSLLAEFDESLLSDVGFSSEELDEVFAAEESPEEFDLQKELAKLSIENIEIKKGDVWRLGEHLMLCGDSTSEKDILKFMGSEKADMCFTDPPYLLDYLRGKKKGGKPTEGFGLKRDRRYLETDVLPDNFTELWMLNVARIQKSDFSIIVFENPKNLRTIWNELEKHWRYRNTIVWHLPNRVQGFAAKYKFFNKHDIALVGTEGNVELNTEPEEEPLFQEEYENALFATSGKPHWESYRKGKRYCPTDFVEFKAADEASSGQGIIFGTKPLPILIPYLKVLTRRGDIVIDPFGGSGSTLIACEKLGRQCRLVEKSPVYAEVIRKRWERLTGKKASRIDENTQG